MAAAAEAVAAPTPTRLDPAGLDRLIQVLRAQGYMVMGPRVREGAIVYDEVRAAAELPQGWTDEQDGGHYRLLRRGDDAYFGYAVGPHSWKRLLHPPRETLWTATRQDAGFTVEAPEAEAPRYAFLGVRACELQAIAVQDRVFLQGPYREPNYALRREQCLLVAVQCTEPGGTCFCASMGTGPAVQGGADLTLTEVVDATRHHFIAQAGTPAGEAVLAALDAPRADEAAVAEADRAVAAAAERMGRHLEDEPGVKALLQGNYEHPQWDDVAARCLACGNCTLVCPTCFCTTTEEVTSLDGAQSSRERRWDSCFNLDFSYIHGGAVRQSTRARYRQWMTHKLANWYDQFGTSGCVGCGRCITWCPVGIDITAEVRAIRAGHGREA